MLALSSTESFQGKYIAITGATSGIGYALAQYFCQQGATIILMGHHVKRLEQTYDSIKSYGVEPVAALIDLAKCSEDDLKDLANQLHTLLGKLDGLIHCASHFYNLAKLEVQSMDEWQAVMRMNVIAPAMLTKNFLPLLHRSEAGRVIFTSETHADHGRAYWGNYGASKAAVQYLAQTLADENEQQGKLKFNVLVPGPVQSPLRSRTHPGELKESLRPAVELAPYYAYLLSANCMKNGETCYIPPFSAP